MKQLTPREHRFLHSCVSFGASIALCVSGFIVASSSEKDRKEQAGQISLSSPAQKGELSSPDPRPEE